MKFPHIVFLDFDGPLFSERALLMPENNGGASAILGALELDPMVSYFKADPVAIAMLHSLYDIRTYQIVITSSWAEAHTREQIQRLLNINDVNISMHKNWKIEKKGFEKSEAISNWINENKLSDYLILDDLDSCEKLNEERHIRKLGLSRSKIMIVDEREGITMKDFYKLQAIVANWD